MLKLTGKAGKSLIVEAIQERYEDLRVYSYNNYIVPTMECFHVDCNDCSVEEFSKFIYEDILKCKNDDLPIGIVVIYTNLQNIEVIEKLADRLESEYLAKMVIITGK